MFRRHLFRTTAAGLLLTASVAFGSACVSEGRVYVRVGPPAPIYEVRTVAPGPGYIWVEGYHRWDGRAYVWINGRWAMPPRPRAVWVGGHWDRNSHGYFWVDGRWRY